MKRKPLHAAEPEMRSEYDFSGAVRGRHFRRYHESSNVVVLEPDVHERFRNSAAVNKALRGLIREGKSKRAKKSGTGR